MWVTQENYLTRQHHGNRQSSDEYDTDIKSSSESGLRSSNEDHSNSDSSSDRSRSASADDNNHSYNESPLYDEQDESDVEWQSLSHKRKLPAKAVLCFSSVYYNVTDTTQQKAQHTAQSSTDVLKLNGESVSVNVHLDTGGSQNLASEHLLHNIKPAEAYGQDHIYMVTVNGNSPANDHIGELNFTDEDGTPIIILCYVQVQSIKGYDGFVLISISTITVTCLGM